MASEVTRRGFVKAGATAAGIAATLAPSTVLGANEKIRCAFIGVANRGGQLIQAALESKERIEIVAVCDVDDLALARWKETLPEAKQYKDYREVIARADVDAVFIASPDHWHPIMCIEACKAGKDVYVEKPLSATIHEGRRMIEVARETGRIVQVGLHRRSAQIFHDLHDLVAADYLGHVTVAHAYRITNMWPSGIGKSQHEDPPATLDWDMWLGPRPERPYQDNIAPYKFRWWQLYSSQMGNWGVHYFDLIRWLVDEEAPVSVSCHGGRFAIDDDRTIPDTAIAVFEFASGRILEFGQYEASGYRMLPSEIDLRGTKGICYASGNKFQIIPETDGQFQKGAERAEAMEVKAQGANSSLTAQHIANFLDCMASRATPNCDVEEGHKSTVFCHLANIALATKSRLEWDAEKEEITGNKEANDLLHYKYREPWTLG